MSAMRQKLSFRFTTNALTARIPPINPPQNTNPPRLKSASMSPVNATK